MPVSSNLSQLIASSQSQASSASSLAKAQDTSKTGDSSFAKVFAKQGNTRGDSAVNTKHADAEKAPATNDKKPAAADNAKGKDDKVADSGKALPAGKADKATKADAKDKDKDTAPDGDEVANAPVIDPTLETVGLTPTPAPTDPNTPQATPEPAADPALAAAALASTQPATSQAAPAEEAFDPQSDPLEDLPMVRMALEHNAKAQGTTSAHATETASKGEAKSEAKTEPSFADNLASIALDTAEKPGEKGGDSLASTLGDDAAPSVGSASGKDSVDDFAARLTALTQPVAAKAAPAVPSNQPLALQQSGWTEGLVNRVMYLSSQNLKSADIQLHPAELGRLDIRVDITPDQQTQVTFASSHIQVREALESQQHRLREMLAQQGMSQVDVNVSDQSRQSQQQQAQTQGSAWSNRSGDSDEAGTDGAEGVANVAQVESPSMVIGSSVVDYYA